MAISLWTENRKKKIGPPKWSHWHRVCSWGLWSKPGGPKHTTLTGIVRQKQRVYSTLNAVVWERPYSTINVQYSTVVWYYGSEAYGHHQFGQICSWQPLNCMLINEPPLLETRNMHEMHVYIRIQNWRNCDYLGNVRIRCENTDHPPSSIQFEHSLWSNNSLFFFQFFFFFWFLNVTTSVLSLVSRLCLRIVISSRRYSFVFATPLSEAFLLQEDIVPWQEKQMNTWSPIGRQSWTQKSWSSGSLQTFLFSPFIWYCYASLSTFFYNMYSN